MKIDLKQLAGGRWTTIGTGQIHGNDIDIYKDGCLLDKSFARTIKCRTPMLDEFVIWNEKLILQVEYDYDAKKTNARIWRP
jgi:hypothetical protein